MRDASADKIASALLKSGEIDSCLAKDIYTYLGESNPSPLLMQHYLQQGNFTLAHPSLAPPLPLKDDSASANIDNPTVENLIQNFSKHGDIRGIRIALAYMQTQLGRVTEKALIQSIAPLAMSGDFLLLSSYLCHAIHNTSDHESVLRLYVAAIIAKERRFCGSVIASPSEREGIRRISNSFREVIELRSRTVSIANDHFVENYLTEIFEASREKGAHDVSFHNFPYCIGDGARSTRILPDITHSLSLNHNLESSRVMLVHASVSSEAFERDLSAAEYHLLDSPHDDYHALFTCLPPDAPSSAQIGEVDDLYKSAYGYVAHAAILDLIDDLDADMDVYEDEVSEGSLDGFDESMESCFEDEEDDDLSAGDDDEYDVEDEDFDEDLDAGDDLADEEAEAESDTRTAPRLFSQESYNMSSAYPQALPYVASLGEDELPESFGFGDLGVPSHSR